MSTKTKQPLNITINGNEMNEKMNNNEYENYIINSNKELTELNKKLEINIKEKDLELQIKEDELDKEEAKRIYMKGLMHNIYEMQQKTEKMCKKYKELNNNYKNYFETYKKIFYTLNKYFSSENTQFIILLGLIVPILLIALCYILNSSIIAVFLIFYQIMIFMAFAFVSDQIYNDKNIDFFEKINSLNLIHERKDKEINNLEKDVKDIKLSTEDLNIIIDNC